MEILANADEWTANDEEQLARFLDTPTGKRLIPALTKEVPVLLEGGDTNAILIRSGQVLAFQKMVETLIFLAHPPKGSAPPAVTNYPALENDAAWNDGQTLTLTSPENPTKE
jgi:hypothetical protein